jgi:hypothetical protein
MSKNVGAGDRLARGAVRATYSTTETKISQESWDAMFADFDPETFEMPKSDGTGEKETSKAREFGKS